MGHRSTRRPRIDEVDRVDTGMVRNAVAKGQKQVQLGLSPGSIQLELIWSKRTAGLFGSTSAAIANRRRLSIKNPEGWQLRDLEEANDRGQTQGLVLYLACPKCCRRCRVLYSRRNLSDFGCVKCNRPAYESNSWPYTGRKNAGGISKHERTRLKHEQAAKRIRKQLGERPQAPAHARAIPAKIDKQKPPGMSIARFHELILKLDIEEKLALLASTKSLTDSSSWQRLLLRL